jgi:hypothetical protein
LRKLEGTRCPECGTDLRLSVSPAEPVLRGWIAATTIASLGSGIGLLFFAIVLGRAGMPPSRYQWIVYASWACMPLTATLVWKRRVFLRWSAAGQWAIVALLAFLVIALVVGIANIR